MAVMVDMTRRVTIHHCAEDANKSCVHCPCVCSMVWPVCVCAHLVVAAEAFENSRQVDLNLLPFCNLIDPLT